MSFRHGLYPATAYPYPTAAPGAAQTTIWQWIIDDEDTGHTPVALTTSRKQAIDIIEGIVLREFVWQVGLKPGCWHHLVYINELTLTCEDCGGYLGIRTPNQQSKASES